MHVRSLAIGFSLVLLSATASIAQVSVSPYAGLMIYDGSLMIYENGGYAGSGIVGDAPVPVAGFRIGYDVGSRWVAELSYGRSWLENARGDLAAHLYHGTLQYSFHRSPSWDAHLELGGGLIDFRPSSPALNSLSDATVAGGLGVAYRVARAVQVRMDLRFIGQLCQQEDDRNGLVCNDGSQLGYTVLTAGVRFRP